MAEIERNDNVQNLMNDLDLHPDTQVETEVYNGMEQQEMTNNRRRYDEDEEYYDDEPEYPQSNQSDYEQEQSYPVEEEEYVEEQPLMPDEDNDGIPDNEEIGTYREEDNYPDALEEEIERRKQQEETFLISENMKRELEEEERREKRKEMFNNVKSAGAGLVGAAAGFFAGKTNKSKPKQSNPNYKAPKKVQVTQLSNGRTGVKTQHHEFGVNPLGQGTFFSAPQPPRAPSPYGAKPRAQKQVSYEEDYDPIGFKYMGNGFEQNNPFGLEQQLPPQNNNSKKSKKWGKDTRSYGEIFGFEQYEQNDDVFGFGTFNGGGGISGDVLGLGDIQSGGNIFGFDYAQPTPKKSVKKSKKSQSQQEFESVFGFKFV